jgi:hypothetical protein
MIRTQMIEVLVKFLMATHVEWTCVHSNNKEYKIYFRKSCAWTCYTSHLCRITGVWIWLFTHHIQFLFECLGIGSSRYWRYFNRITTMQRQLGDSQDITLNSTFGQLLTHHKISGRLHNGRTIDYRRGNIPILRAYILPCLYQRIAP